MTIAKHILLVSVPGWGHLRPLIALACKIILQERNIGITLLAPGTFGERIPREIGRNLPKVNLLGEHIRVIHILKEVSDDLAANLFSIEDNFKNTYDAIQNDDPITCMLTGKVFQVSGWPRAQTIIADMFLSIFKYIRYVTPKARIFLFNSGNTAAMLRLIGSEEIGGLGDIYAKARVVSRETGEDVDEVATKIFRPINGHIINLAGLPPIYDYEMNPQETDLDDKIHLAFIGRGTDFLMNSDGVVSVSSIAYESAGIEVFKKWLLNSRRQLYAMGPLLPSGIILGAVSKENAQEASQNGYGIEQFLAHALETYGKHSVIYISFGSFFWPRIEYLLKIIEVIMELKFPFILSHSSPRAIIPPELTERVKASGMGLLCSWTPQQSVLNHPATGWFLTHCGQNSVVEALAAGVPMIAWPLEADQPVNAIQLTLVHDVAYELLEVRTGEAGLKPLFRGVQPSGTIQAIEAEAWKVFKAARGPDGERKRKNAHLLRNKMKAAWEERGDAVTELNRFLSDEFP